MRQQNNPTIYINRVGGILYSEYLLCALIMAIITVKYFALTWSIGVVLFFPYVFLLDYLFFKFYIWRWIFSAFMSAGWGYFAYLMTEIFTAANQNSLILGFAMLIFMLWVHRSEYLFESTAIISVFDYQSGNN